ncbi:unnamed protein product, partial [Discosporangium mesarthrocarpum]
CCFYRWIILLYSKNLKCPLELSIYFRINTCNKESGQFERTLTIAEE